MSTNTKPAEPVNAAAVLRNVLNTLKRENDKPDGRISDTIWYSAYETLFDYVESSLEALAAHDAEQAAQAVPAGWKHDCAGLLTNDLELWIDRCPHCGKPAPHAPSPPAPEAQRREPLTDEQIRREKPVCADWVSFRAGVRCAERIHGVGK